LRLKGFPSTTMFFGAFSFHFFRNGKSSASLRSSSGSISGISSRIGYHLWHLEQTIMPSTISSFSSKTYKSSGWYLSIGQARISISLRFIEVHLGTVTQSATFKTCSMEKNTVNWQIGNTINQRFREKRNALIDSFD